MHELVVRLEFLGFAAFGDRGGVIPFPIIRHAQSEPGVEMRRVHREHSLEFGDRTVVIARAEREHRVVVLLLQRNHNF